VRCSDCGTCAQDPITFCAGPYVTHTKWLVKYVLALRKEMSISAVAQFPGLHWDSVKQIEKTYLLKKYKKPSLAEVRDLGIYEVYLGRKLDYIAVVRYLESGAVLFIGKGKGGAALQALRQRIRSKAKQIKAVTMDMSNGCSAWVAEVLPLWGANRRIGIGMGIPEALTSQLVNVGRVGMRIPVATHPSHVIILAGQPKNIRARILGLSAQIGLGPK
jgi:hypothetical protein